MLSQRTWSGAGISIRMGSILRRPNHVLRESGTFVFHQNSSVYHMLHVAVFYDIQALMWGAKFAGV